MHPNGCSEFTRLAIRHSLALTSRDTYRGRTADDSIPNTRLKITAKELSEHQKYCNICQQLQESRAVPLRRAL